jgi:CDP-6-deoxy-D-xylo-4-hexulose-3-dehydrase
MNLQLSKSSWGPEERQAIIETLDSGDLTMGRRVAEFERVFADYIGTTYAVMVNSGSSANLLMVAAWTLRYGNGTVIVPALGWSTSYSPFQQYGWKLRFVDIDRRTLNYDLKELWQANEHDDADLLLAINILGNPNDFGGFPKRVRILEDNCESLGAEYRNRRTGAFGVMSSHSLFYSHHICTMEGGVVTTDDEHFYHMLLALRSHGWTRHLPKENIFVEKPSAFRFVLPGYNVRPTEMQGAVGLEQMKKIDRIIAQRRQNAMSFPSFPWKMQKEIGKSSWHGFSLLDDDIDSLKARLDGKGVEYRPILAGNFTRHPAIKFYNYESGNLGDADYVHDHGVMIGNHPAPIDWHDLS